MGLGLDAVFFAIALMQGAACTGDAARQVREAVARAEAFDLAAAADAYLGAAAAGCVEAEVGGIYLRGLAHARHAYAQGGSPDSLAAVAQAIAGIDARRDAAPAVAPIARAVLQAASAGAQSERAEMSLLIDYAVRLEALQLEAGQSGLPGVTAHEAAGDLWLQVHGYDEARRAYQRAAERVGPTARVRLGLARVAARTKDVAAACRYYGELTSAWPAGPDAPAELIEARDYVATAPCRPSGGTAAPGRGAAGGGNPAAEPSRR